MSKVIALDIESVGLQPWDKTSELVSIGLAWRNDAGEMQTYFTKGFQNIEAVLTRLAETQDKILVYNQSFEMRWFNYYWPHLQLNWHADVMRLVQLHGTSSDNANMTVEIDGFGLKPAVTRILGKLPTAAEEIYGWIHSNYKTTKAQAGQYLATAPDDILERYNLEDSIYTLELYEHLTAKFDRIKFDWTRDQDIYQGVVKELVSANLTGFPVRRADVQQYISDIEQETIELDNLFLSTYQQEILNVRELLRQKEQAKFKKKIVTELPEFNPGSRQHLKMLLVDQLGVAPTIFSPTGEPSFKAAHMHLYGEAGKMLENRGKRQIIKAQAEALLRVSALDGKFHPELKTCGTITGRFAGSSGLNVQGISRNDKRLMEFFEAPPGMQLVEIDAISGEATITAAYSNDPVYKFQVFEGVGVKPYYRDDGLLMISDPYIALTSVSTVGSKELKETFYSATFDGLTFAEQWVKDPEVVKAHPVIKKYRKVNKMLSLALSYGLGAKKLMKQVEEQFGLVVTEATAKQVVKSYWKQYADIKAFASKCSHRVSQNGYLVNEFGYRTTPADHKAFNALIQSTMSGIVNYKILLLREYADYWQLYTVIHDAIILVVPEDKVKDLKKVSQMTDKIINEGLRWSVDVKFGFNAGRNLWETK